LSTLNLPAPIAFDEVARVAREVADAVRGQPIAKKARMVAAYLDAELNRMSGDELCELRLRANLSQAEVAERLGVSQPTVSDMERGRRPVTAEAAMLGMMLEARARREGQGRG
jgi:DNA-binding transcriptional regulator YiaG